MFSVRIGSKSAPFVFLGLTGLVPPELKLMVLRLRDLWRRFVDMISMSLKIGRAFSRFEQLLAAVVLFLLKTPVCSNWHIAAGAK